MRNSGDQLLAGNNESNTGVMATQKLGGVFFSIAVRPEVSLGLLRLPLQLLNFSN